MEEQFRIRKNGFEEVRKRIIITMSLFMLLIMTSVLLIGYFNSKTPIFDSTTLFIAIPFFLILTIYSITKTLKNQKIMFDSYRLTIGDNVIEREQGELPKMSIPFEEIKEIIKTSNDTFLIVGKSPQEVIGVPSQIENKEELELELSKIKEITTNKKKTLIQKYFWLPTLLVLVLFAIVFISNNKLLVGISGFIVVSMLIYSLIKIQKSKHLDNKTKKKLWVVVFPIISVIIVVIAKLSM